MVTLELSDREAMLIAVVLDMAIVDFDVEIDILSMHYPEQLEEIEALEEDLETIYTISDAVDTALWAAEVRV